MPETCFPSALKFRDVAEARGKTQDEVDALAAPILSELRAIPVPHGAGDRDAAGIALRGGSVFDAVLSMRWTRAQLAAAYVVLWGIGAQTVLVDCLEAAWPND